MTQDPFTPLFTLPDPPLLRVTGRRAAFPVGRIFCVARNYADHAREMGAVPAPPTTPPVFFMKPVSALAHDGDVLPYPADTKDLHHEVELVAAIDSACHNAGHDDALAAIYGYAVGIDLTRRDVQTRAKQAGDPWDMAKGFDFSAPVGTILPVPELEDHPPHGAIRLSVNGDVRQNGRLEDMIWSVGHLVSALSHQIALRPGDLLFTGTPAGVGAIQPGDRLNATIDAIGNLSVTVR